MKFAYTAKSMGGQKQKGQVDAVSVQNAVESIRGQGLVPITVTEVKMGIGLGELGIGISGVKSSDIANFTRQLSTMITAGLPLTDALSLLKAQSPPPLAKVVSEILLDVQSGISLSAAMAKHPKVFSKVYVALVKAGEAAGVMETVLNRLAENTEKSREFSGKVKGAMVYPVIVLIGMAIVMAVMVLFVVPKLTAMYADFGAELPIATKMVMSISDFSIHYWWLAAIVIVGGVFGGKAYLQTSIGRYQWDELVYKIPVWGALGRQIMLTELTGTLGLLVGSGVSVVEALNIVSGAVGNVVVEKDVKRIAKQVEKGFPVSISFSESLVFPPIVGQMVAVGEETGKMDDVLSKLEHFFGSESEQKVKALTTAIEPLIIIVLAVGVGFLMYAIVMPIYGITNKF